MTTENIIEDILSGNIAEAKSKTDELLYSKLMDSLAINKEDVASSTFDDAVGVASLVEKKKKKKKGDDDEEYAKKTDKEDDGEGLDPVDAEDSDVDNDGDEDESDEYLKNRRKVRKKEIEDDEEEEVKEGKEGDGRASYIYGMEIKKYRNLTDKQKHQIKIKWSHKKSHEDKEKGHSE